MNVYIIIGSALLIGLLFAILVDKIKIPSIAGYIIGGILLGVYLKFLKINISAELNIISNIALGIIAFIIGGEIRMEDIRHLGRSIFFIVFFETLFAFILVSVFVYLFSKNPALSLILGAISAATAPAATVMVIEQYKCDGPLTKTLLTVVGLDDAAALIIYSFAIAVAKVFIDPSFHLTVSSFITAPLIEIGGSVLVGIIMGFITGLYLRYRNGSKMEYLGIILGVLFITIGLDNMLHFSGLLSSLTLGFIITNFVPHKSRRFFSGLRDFSPPFYICFFVLAGTRLDIFLLPQIGFLGIVYFISRIIGKMGGATLGAVLSHASENVKRYIGFGLLSQVGIAIGLAVIIYNTLVGLGPEGERTANIIINILLTTTILTEIIGPLMVKYSMIKSNEIEKRNY